MKTDFTSVKELFLTEKKLENFEGGIYMKRERTGKQDTNNKQRNFKDFLYLNMDFLETFVAQIDDGYKESDIMDDTRREKTVKGTPTTTFEANVEGKLNKILEQLVKLNGGAKVAVQSAPEYDIDEHVSRNVIHMKQRENILDRFIKHIDLENYVNEIHDDDLGKYISLRTYFDYINLSRLEMFLDKEVYDFCQKQEIESKFALEGIKSKLSLLKKLFPFDTFLYAKGVIVLINDDYLRDVKGQAGYKFNSKVTVIGFVNKLASKYREHSVTASMAMDQIQIATLSLLRELGFVHKDDKEIYLVTPIAIYV